ncbi:actin-related protein 2/3 complex subunit 1A-like [Antedon mediterranea]|uniref:actin-related protein 2/3 complex subunit 1A-like n=1 Tax=Antedon mediterranea TaxID=105859 RepID=UPI003AF57B18
MEKFSFGVEPVTCHAWNGDRTQIAISPNSHEVHIYNKKGGGWEKTFTMNEHTQRVTSIDWAASSNRIVTCGTDRNAYVWVLNGKGEWRPTLVILRINRAATCVKWSPREDKFAVGSGARLISICYFEKENDWWVSKHIKKPIRSTVTCLDWHPNNVLLGCGSTDFKVRVFSTYVKEIEAQKPDSTPWGKKMSFGNLMSEVTTAGGWIHDVSFSSDGNRLAWVCHNSTINVVDAASDSSVTTTRTPYLPFLTCSWINPSALIVGGHDCELMRYSVEANGKITFVKKIAVASKKAAGKVSAMAMFQKMDKLATTDEEKGKNTVHQNSITQVSIHTGTKESVSKLSSTGVDGQLVVWNMS